MVEHASIAILYCITNERCAGLDATNDERHSFVSTLNKIGEEMANRHADYQECNDGSDCERKDMEEVSRKGPRGLMSRIKHSLDEDDSGQEACEANGRTWAENRRECYSEDDYDRKDFQRFEVTQEVCEDREGIWTQAPDRLGEDYYYCDWSIYEFDHPTSDDSDDSKR